MGKGKGGKGNESPWSGNSEQALYQPGSMYGELAKAWSTRFDNPSMGTMGGMNQQQIAALLGYDVPANYLYNPAGQYGSRFSRNPSYSASGVYNPNSGQAPQVQSAYNAAGYSPSVQYGPRYNFTNPTTTGITYDPYAFMTPQAPQQAANRQYEPGQSSIYNSYGGGMNQFERMASSQTPWGQWLGTMPWYERTAYTGHGTGLAGTDYALSQENINRYNDTGNAGSLNSYGQPIGTPAPMNRAGMKQKRSVQRSFRGQKVATMNPDGSITYMPGFGGTSSTVPEPIQTPATLYGELVNWRV